MQARYEESTACDILDKQTESNRPSEKPKPRFQTACPVKPAAETAQHQKETT
ncbi:hypothetical protein [Neisseria elongata]|uniref:Uncharacterized protein n=1 Tax=Neisseria elongata subsp. glycolytica ATCC 29315 TaxID=546263 RepID=D4DRK1_NEIEG|nr:hypothetical protein [Neisseria elongata]EFE49603.1 hypothetical protein NEIELOOT_01694 [Neisseria elongata subsp. glycolytica ATCC 29315]